MTTQQQITTSVLDEKIALVSISIGMFGGYRRATAGQIEELGGKLPNSNAITEGSIKVFPNDAMKVFQTSRRRLFRDIAAKGVKALGSSNVFAIPKACLAEIEKKIADAANEHAAAKAQLDADYESLFEQHVSKNPEAERIIRGLKVDRVAALARLHFSSSVFSIRPLVREGEDPEAGVAGIVAGLARQLFSEISAEMTDLLDTDSLKRGKAGQKTLRPIKAAVAKMKGLEFIDPRTVGGCVNLINQVLATLPGQGYIEDVGQSTPFSNLKKLVETLADEESLIDAASRVANGQSASDVLYPKPPAPVIVPVLQTVVPVDPVPVVAQAQSIAPLVSAVMAPRTMPRMPSMPPRVPTPARVASPMRLF